MKTHDDPARAEQAAAMLDHLLAHYETFCETRPAGRIPESFMRELHELYYYRTGCIDTATAWQAPIPPMQDGDPGDGLRSRLVLAGLRLGARLWRINCKIRLAYFVFRTVWIVGRPADPRPAMVLALAALWPFVWLLAHR